MRLLAALQHLFDPSGPRPASPDPERTIDTPLRFPDRPSAYPPDASEIPVLVVAYYPVRNGLVDIAATGDVGGPLPAVQDHVRRTTGRVIGALEVGSTYHGYKDPAAQPALRYRIVDWLEFLEPLPTWHNPRYTHVPMTDYNAIMDRVDIETQVMTRGVKEVWVWGYHGNVVGLWESNMAGPYGDISNSDRDPADLPALPRTYTVYHYNYQRGPSEAVEDHMHQIEAVLRHVDHDLFWNRFVGRTGEGRCGWTHYPPNAVRDYDWANRHYAETDLEDWRPDGSGAKLWMNCRRWHCDSLTWFTYWMQNIPGRDNGLVDHGRPLTNWWTFIGDFDRAMGEGMGLVG